MSSVCPEAIERCYKEIPELRTIAPEHQVACHRASKLSLKGL